MAEAELAATTAQCHCGRVRIGIAVPLTEVTYCNCSLCHSTGVRWFYPEVEQITLPNDAALTQTYAWNGKHVDFHRCSNCGCVTHWVPRDAKRTQRGVNARLLPPEVLTTAAIKYQDGAKSGLFADCPGRSQQAVKPASSIIGPFECCTPS